MAANNCGNVDPADDLRAQSIFAAAQAGDADEVNRALSALASDDERRSALAALVCDGEGQKMTALIAAAMNGHQEVVRALALCSGRRQKVKIVFLHKWHLYDPKSTPGYLELLISGFKGKKLTFIFFI